MFLFFSFFTCNPLNSCISDDLDVLFLYSAKIVQAEPLFKDKKRFVEMADPLLDGKFPTKALYQALAVAAMCLQEDASSRPLISDVVTALKYLSTPKRDPLESSPQSAKASNNKDNANEGGCIKE